MMPGFMEENRPISVLLPSLEPVSVIERYRSLDLSLDFYDLGSFQIEVKMEQAQREKIKKRMVVDFGYQGEIAGIIRGVAHHLTATGVVTKITGTMLNGLMKNRITVPSDDPAMLGWDVASGTVGSIFAHYVNGHAIHPLAPVRKIPNLRIAAGIEQIGMETVASARFDLVSDVLYGVAQYGSVGWRIVIVDDMLEFQAIPARDRTRGSDNPIILSTAFKNINTATVESNEKNYANAVYALGEGSYENRLHQVFYSGEETIAGWNRVETVVDCGNEGDVARLETRALQKIADLEQTDSMTLALIPGTVRVDIGDIVTVSLPELGAEYDLLVTNLRGRVAGSTKTITTTLGRPPMGMKEQFERSRRLSNIT